MLFLLLSVRQAGGTEVPVSTTVSITSESASSSPAQATNFMGTTTESLLESGTALLKSGRNLNRAIELLSAAASREPHNLDVQTALGCAYASRFASIAEAVRLAEAFQRDQRVYEKLRSVWESAQTDPSRAEYGAPEPVAPSLPTTPDDGRVFALSESESRQVLKDLGCRSVAAFDTAHRIVENDTGNASAARRDSAEYTRGWGLFLIRRFGKDLVEERPIGTRETTSVKDHLYISKSDVADCFRHYVQNNPASADGWHALAVALVPNYVQVVDGEGYLKYLNGGEVQKPEEVAAALDALQHALDARPDDFDLLYQLAMISFSTRPEEATHALEQATHRRRNEATLWYLLAEQRFQMAKKIKEGAKGGSGANGVTEDQMQGDAIASVIAGNRAANYRAISFNLPVPSELRRPWDYFKPYGYGDDTRVLSALFRYVGDYTSRQITLHAENETMAGVQALMDMGTKAVKAASAGDLDVRDPRMRLAIRNRIFYGTLACERAYDLVKQAQSIQPNERKERYINDCASLMDYMMSVQKEVMNNH